MNTLGTRWQSGKQTFQNDGSQKPNYSDQLSLVKWFPTSQARIQTHIRTTPEVESDALDRSTTALLYTGQTRYSRSKGAWTHPPSHPTPPHLPGSSCMSIYPFFLRVSRSFFASWINVLMRTGTRIRHNWVTYTGSSHNKCMASTCIHFVHDPKPSFIHVYCNNWVSNIFHETPIWQPSPSLSAIFSEWPLRQWRTSPVGLLPTLVCSFTCLRSIPANLDSVPSPVKKKKNRNKLAVLGRYQLVCYKPFNWIFHCRLTGWPKVSTWRPHNLHVDHRQMEQCVYNFNQKASINFPQWLFNNQCSKTESLEQQNGRQILYTYFF